MSHRSQPRSQCVRRLQHVLTMFASLSFVWTAHSAEQVERAVEMAVKDTVRGSNVDPSLNVVSSSSGTFIVGRPVAFGLTPPVRNIPQAPVRLRKESEEKAENNRVKYPVPGAGAGVDAFVDPLLALNRSLDLPSAMPAPSLTFMGQNNTEACGCQPPDTNGDVGPNHYVQSTNTRVSVYSKTGTRLLGPSLQSTAFFAGLPAGNACRTSDDGDPVVLYDSMADRWLVSQFSIGSVPGHQCIAISQTSDPTGAWYAYDFVMPNTKFHDYPHYGVWPDGYYLTTNQFNQAGTAFQGPGLFAFDRVKMLAGDQTATFIYHDIANEDPNAGGLMPSDVDGFIPPPAGMPNRVLEFRADEFGDPIDALRTYELVPNYATPASSTFVIKPDIALAAFDARSPNGRDVIEQNGGNALDGLNDRVMFRVAYRNLGSFAAPVNSWVGNFTVNVSGVNPTTAATYQTGVRWFELRSADAAAAPTVRDQGTQSNGPGNGATGVNNWMAGIAQDSQGNIALGYSASGANQKANIMIAGRTGAGTGAGLPEGEAVFATALGAQSNGNRWGDYSAMSVDPVDECTFWYTQEYFSAAATSSWETRIGKFVFPGCTTTPLPKGFIAAHVTNCGNGLPIAGATVTATGGFVQTTNAAGDLLVNMGVAPGSYTVAATKFNFSNASTPATVTNGATSSVNLCIIGTPDVASSGSTITAENYAPANNALDPGEQVSVDFCALNTGGADTVNLIGTLQATGGVTSPSAAQSYGVVVSGGSMVCRSFSFTVNPALLCGDTVTATIDFADGANGFGGKTYALRTGTAGPTNTQTFSYTGPVAAIPDNASAGVDLTVPVSGMTGEVSDVNVTFDVGAGGACDAAALNANAALNHTWIGDLAIKLTAPNATSTVIDSRRGNQSDNFCATLFDDDGGYPLLSTLPGTNNVFVSGNFTPDNALSILDGSTPNGNWVLNVSDNAGADTGSMRRFSLVISSQARQCSSAPSNPDVLFLNGFE